MICIFPDPYPDELLYSVCARYRDLMQYPNNTTAINDFFGNGTISAVVDFPNRLEHLVSELPPGHLYTVDEFIFEHTQLPFYSPFLSCERARLVREEMRRDGENRVSARIGHKASSSARLQWLRFCPLCVDADRRQFGETYWHRIHQLPGIDVCPQHATFLEMSSVSFSHRAFNYMAISAESALHDRRARPLNMSEPVHKVLLDIACNAAWLLRWEGGSVGSDILRERYYNRLLSRGLAYYNGKVRSIKLVTDFVKFYPPGVLKSLDCEIKNTYRNWLLRLVHSSKVGVSQLPIRHILLILFLGLTAKEFFTTFEEFKPFGVGPWPCLNHAADHHHQPVITECQVTGSLSSAGRPLGTFRCECGFVYTRVGPDTTEGDRFRVSIVESYGPVWEEALRKLWQDTATSKCKAGRQLGVTPLTINRHAIRLDLPMNVPGSRHIGLKTIERHKKFRRSRKDALDHYRKEWLSVLAANPNAGRGQLSEISKFLYAWLRKNDSEWLAANLPPIRRADRQRELKNWEAIDMELAATVEAAARRIKGVPGRPKWLCLRAVVKEVGHESHLEKQLDKLPRTATVLGIYIESREAHMIRKIMWAEESYQQEGRCPTRLQLMYRAGARSKTGESLPVQYEVNAALVRLRERFTTRV